MPRKDDEPKSVVATVNRVIRWHDGTMYELREGREFRGPEDVTAFLRRVGYVRPVERGGDT